MKPAQSDRVVSGNLQGDTIHMGFAVGAEKHLMSIMAGMYSDMELAILREYATNARDSHIEASQSRPIEVSLPSPLSPYLKIKDYGVGMNVADIHRTYSQYGASTKRDSNDYNGVLGIGSKSALAYSGQFSVIAVQDSIKTTVAVTRAEDGSNNMVIVDTSTTSDPNGVEVSIPVKGGNEIERKAHGFFAYWPHGTVLLNGAEPRRPDEADLKISDTIKLVKVDRYGGSQSRVVMGNVPYPVEAGRLDHNGLGIPYGHAIIAYVPMGAVDFAPSREALTYSKHTLKCLDRIAAEFKAGLLAAVQKEIEKAPKPYDAVKAINRWSSLLGRNRPASFRHKGRDVPTTITRSATQRADGSHPRLMLTPASSYKLSSVSNMPNINLTYAENSVIVTDYDMASFTATHKKKLLQWLSKQSDGIRSNTQHFILVDFKIDTHWIDPSRLVAWATVQAEQLPKAARNGSSGRLAGSYDLMVKVKGDETARAKWGEDGSKIDRSKPVFYLHGNLQKARVYTNVLSAIMDDYTVICLPANRIDKFKRDNPAIGTVESAINGAFDKWVAKLTPDQKAAMAIQEDYYEKRAIARYGQFAHKIDDPAIKEAVRLSNLNVEKLLQENRAFGRFGDRAKYEWTDPMADYPLADFDGASQETIEYINWRYAQRKCDKSHTTTP